MKKPYILGHRGASGHAPENTRVAFEKARELGADGVEFDVQMTKDGIPVVIHDENVVRTTDGQGLVKDLTLEEFKTLDAGSHFGPEFAGEELLTLDETLETVRDFRLINIEIKNGPIFYPDLEEKVLEAVARFNLQEKVILSSFNHYSLHKIRELNPDIRIGVLYMSGLFRPWEYAKKLGARALHPFFAAVTPEIVQESHQHGVEVNVFGANDRGILQQLMAAGVDMIITDYPERAIKLRDNS